MELKELNTTQRLLLEKLDNETIYVITRDLQTSDSTENGFCVGTYGTEYKLVCWFITEQIDNIFNGDKEQVISQIDLLLTCDNKIKMLADLFSITIVKGWKI